MEIKTENPWDQELKLEGWLDVLGKAAKGALGAVMGSSGNSPLRGEKEKGTEKKNSPEPANHNNNH